MTGKGKLSLDVSCGNPANATNRSRFSTAEWPDMNATYRILGASMPSLEGSRDTVWPELCCAMHVWLKENEAHWQRALIIDTDRPSVTIVDISRGCVWTMDGCTMPSSSLGEREVDKELISLSLHAVSG